MDPDVVIASRRDPTPIGTEGDPDASMRPRDDGNRLGRLQIPDVHARVLTSGGHPPPIRRDVEPIDGSLQTPERSQRGVGPVAQVAPLQVPEVLVARLERPGEDGGITTLEGVLGPVDILEADGAPQLLEAPVPLASCHLEVGRDVTRRR